MPTTTKSGIKEISLAVGPATDQDRSIDFYVDLLGFEKRTDIPFGGDYRWVEVYPPAGTTGIALAPPREQDEVGVQTGITLTTDDIDGDYARLSASGVAQANWG